MAMVTSCGPPPYAKGERADAPFADEGARRVGERGIAVGGRARRAPRPGRAARPPPTMRCRDRWRARASDRVAPCRRARARATRTRRRWRRLRRARRHDAVRPQAERRREDGRGRRAARPRPTRRRRGPSASRPGRGARALPSAGRGSACSASVNEKLRRPRSSASMLSQTRREVGDVERRTRSRRRTASGCDRCRENQGAHVSASVNADFSSRARSPPCDIGSSTGSSTVIASARASVLTRRGPGNGRSAETCTAPTS